MESERATTQRRVLIGLGAVVAALAVVVLALAVTSDDDGDEAATTTSSLSSSTTAASTTTAAPATTVPAGELDTSMFPDRSGSRSFDDPVAVATAFAKEVLGFASPVMGSFDAGDSRSGEVAARVAESGSPSVVIVRKQSDDHWYVLGSAAESIVLATPRAGTRLVSPQPLIGQAYAFEGVVNVALYADGNPTPIAETVVTGRGDGVLGDFFGEIDFTVPPGVTRGTLILRSLGGPDGNDTVAASAQRVLF